jgi:hypothetical protein
VANFIIGVMPFNAIFERSLLYVQSQCLACVGKNLTHVLELFIDFDGFNQLPSLMAGVIIFLLKYKCYYVLRMLEI